MRPIVELVATQSFTAVVDLAPELDLERRELDDRVLAADARSRPGLEVVGRDRGEEADRAVVDADHRRPGAERSLQGTQHRPVAAEHDDEIGSSKVAVGDRSCFSASSSG
jgi:hypothetical protein